MTIPLQPYLSRRYLWCRVIAVALLCWAATGNAKPIVAVVDTTFINVHTGPGKGYPKFHVLERDERITILKKRTNWVKIADKDNRTGWIVYGDVAKLNDEFGQRFAFAEVNIDDFFKRRYELGLMLGDFDGAESISVDGTFRFTQNLAASLRLTQATGAFSEHQIGAATLSYLPYPQWRIAPYLIVGTEVVRTQPSATLVQTENRSESAMLAGLGAYVYLSRNFVLRAEFDNHYILTDRQTNEEVNEWKLGFSIFF